MFNNSLLYKEIQVFGAKEKVIYELFFDRDRQKWIDYDLNVYIVVVGNNLEKFQYVHDDQSLIPAWFICELPEHKSLDDFRNQSDRYSEIKVFMTLKFINVSRGVLVQFIWREGMYDKKVELFVEKLIARIEQTAEIKVTQLSSTSGQKSEPEKFQEYMLKEEAINRIKNSKR